MKKLFIIVSIIFSSLIINAQDILVLQNGEEIEAKILEVDQSQIKYQLFSGSSDSVFVVNRADAFMIKYAGGAKDVLNKKAPVTVEEKSVKEKDTKPAIRKKGFLFRPEVSGILVYSELLAKNFDNKASKDLDVGFNILYQRDYKISYGAGVSYNHTTSFGDFIPIYLNVRGYLNNKMVSPYYDFRLGYAICMKDNTLIIDEESYYIFEIYGVYLRGGFGLDVKNFSFGLNIGIIENHIRKYQNNDHTGIIDLNKSENKIEMFFGVNIGYNIQ